MTRHSSRLFVAVLLSATALPSSAQEGRGLPGPRSRRVLADLAAFRPQHGAGYAPFARTAVPEALEEDAASGPGIRMHGAGETDPAGEDDLIEVVARAWLREEPFALQRSSSALRVWTTRQKLPGTEVLFSGNRSSDFELRAPLTLWVERTSGPHGLAQLALVASESDVAVDRLSFHSFRSIVLALGGEGQTPVLPPDPNHGTFLVAKTLYEQGFDVHMYDEDGVIANGTGPVYDEAVNAVQHRGVSEIACYGYSHGGGSTHDLVDRLDADRAAIGTFSVPFTSYVDGVENSSDIDVDRELRLPPTTAYHANHFQRGTLADFFLDGGPIPGSQPGPSGLDVETTPWGMGATHFVVDDFSQVLTFIQTNLIPRVNR